MEFDSLTVVLLTLAPDAPVLDEAADNALQDAHLAHLARLHEEGSLLAAGPLRDSNGGYRGLSILNVKPERARELAEADPAVLAERYSITVLPWMVPAGAMSFDRTSFPHSSAEARS